MTKVISLVGGSGIGKSTTAAGLYYEMKKLGVNCELVREFVKEWAWAGKKVGPYGQSIIYGQQVERESNLYGKVDYIVTDSPLILCPVYQKYYNGTDTIKNQVFNDLNVAKSLGVEHINYILTRFKKFDPRGRYETEQQAVEIDHETENFLKYHMVDYKKVDGKVEEKVAFILSDLGLV